MGCVLSYFRQGTFDLAEGQLTDRLLEGAIAEEHPDAAGQKATAAGGDDTQDDAPEEIPDDDKTLLLGALGATAAGAVTVGAVAGALKAAQDKSEAPATSPATDTRYADEATKGDGGAAPAAAAAVGAGGALTAAALTGAALQSSDSGATAAAAGNAPQRSEIDTEEERGQSQLSGGKDEPASPVATGVANEASQTPVPADWEKEDVTVVSSPEHSEVSKPSEAHQSPRSSTAAQSAGDDDRSPLQSPPAETELQAQSVLRRLSSPAGEERPSASPVAPDDMRSHIGELDDSAQLSSQAVDSLSQPTPVKDESQIQSPAEESFTSLAVVKDELSVQPPEEDKSRDQPTAGEKGFRAQSKAAEEEFHLQSPVEHSRHDQSRAEEEGSRVLTTTIEEVSGVPSKDLEEEFRVLSTAVEEEYHAQPHEEHEYHDQSHAEKAYHVQSTADEESLVQPLVVEDDSGTLSKATEQDHHDQSPAEDESRIQSAVIDKESRAHSAGTEEGSRTQSTAVEVDSPAELRAVEDESRVSSTAAEEEYHVQSTTEKESHIQSTTVEDESRVPSTAAEEEHSAQSATDGESRTQSLEREQSASVQSHVKDDFQPQSATEDLRIPPDRAESDIGKDDSQHDSHRQSSHGENESKPQSDVAKDNSFSQALPVDKQSLSSEAISITASVAGSGVQSLKEDNDREEVDTPQIVPEQRSTDVSPGFEKFMSTLVSPKGGGQESTDRTDDADSNRSAHSAEHTRRPSEVDSAVKSEDSSATQKEEEEELNSRAESRAEAVCGSATDLQEKIATIQSPAPSVQEEPIVKLDRFSIGSDVALAPHYSPKESGTDDSLSDNAHSSVAARADKDANDIQPRGEPAHTDMEFSAGTSVQKSPPGASAAEDSSPRDPPSGVDPAEDTSPSDPPFSVDPVEEADPTHDISEKTEDNEFDPLAQTQSFIFPDELVGRTSQLSEKPSSPFPELDESDIRDTSAVLPPSDTERKELEPDMAAPGTGKVVLETDKEQSALSPGAEKATLEAEKATPEIKEGTPVNEQVEAQQMAPEAEQAAVEAEQAASRTEQIEVEQLAPEVEEAATKIQAGVRGWQARRKISRRQAAATQIQAGFRGWRVRRARHMRRTSSLPELTKTTTSATDDNYMDVDTLKDRAAAKIQAGFRGWRTRQEMKTLATGPLEEALRVSPAISMTEISAEEQAAARIQAGYRGWKTRRTLKRSLSDPNSEALVLAHGLQQRRVAETGASAHQPATVSAADALTSSAEAPTPRDEDETAHSIQSIQSEVASSGATPRQDHTLADAPPTDDLSYTEHHPGDPSKAEPSTVDSSTVEPSADTLSAGSLSKPDPSNADPSVGPLSTADASQQAEAAAKIQAGFRGWKTRQQMRADQTTVRPTESAKSVTDSGALPIDFAIVHRPEDDWLTQDLLKIEAEKRAAKGDASNGAEKHVAAAGDEPDGKDARPDSASTTESSSSWLTHAQTEIRASFQGLRDNVSDALKTVEDTARLVREKGAAGGAESGSVAVVEETRRVGESGGGVMAASGAEPSEEAAAMATEGLTPLKTDGNAGLGVTDGVLGEKSPSEREEEEIWEEIQRSMRHED